MERVYVAAKLKCILHTANHLKSLSLYNINFEVWQNNTMQTLKWMLGADSKEFLKYRSIKYSALRNYQYETLVYHEAYLEGLNKAIEFLEGLMKRLNIDSGLETSADVKSLLECLRLDPDQKEKIMQELMKAMRLLDNTDKSRSPWEWQLQQNKIVKILNSINSINDYKLVIR